MHVYNQWFEKSKDFYLKQAWIRPKSLVLYLSHRPIPLALVKCLIWDCHSSQGRFSAISSLLVGTIFAV